MHFDALSIGAISTVVLMIIAYVLLLISFCRCQDIGLQPQPEPEVETKVEVAVKPPKSSLAKLVIENLTTEVDMLYDIYYIESALLADFKLMYPDEKNFIIRIRSNQYDREIPFTIDDQKLLKKFEKLDNQRKNVLYTIEDIGKFLKHYYRNKENAG